MNIRMILIALFASLPLVSCGGGGGGGGGTSTPPPPPPPPTLDQTLRGLINQRGLTGDPTRGKTLPDISDPLPQLGKKLFFSKSLGGEFESACVSCHHPVLGGGDSIALSVGTGALDPDLLGPGREHMSGEPNLGRHSQTTFNTGLYETGLFWDSRIQRSATGIRTPDSAFNTDDPNAGTTLAAAQARFPVIEPTEMRTDTFEAGENNDTVRAHLAARIGDYGVGTGEIANNQWLAEFQTAFNSNEPADQLVTFDNIAHALGEYVRSQVFVDTPWKAYVEGNVTAISDSAKRGAIEFFRDPPDLGDDGAGCHLCHTGDFFTDEKHFTVAFPQFGRGKGDGAEDDFGRERQSAVARERYRFRTPELLNLSATAPYTHTGAYETLDEVVRHYSSPQAGLDRFFAAGGWCQLEQFANTGSCASLYPNAEANSDLASAKINDDLINDGLNALLPITLTDQEVNDIVAFLLTLNDPCTTDRACLAPWIPEPAEAPDGHQLNATDRNGVPL